MPTPEENEKTVRAFLELAFNQRRPREASELYLGATYTQHNPGVIDGKQGFVDTVLDVFPEDKQLDIKRVIATEDHVVTHQLVTSSLGDHANQAVIDIFRVDEAGKLVEHWDVVMPATFDGIARNGNGLF